MVGTCLFCCRWASGAFQSEEFDADTDTVSNTKACCSHYLLPCSFMFTLFFLAHFMIGNLDFMQVSRCISVCRENPNSRALLKKERKKERKLPVPQFLGLGFRDAAMLMVLWVGSYRGVLATIAVFLGYCLLQAPPT
jgi:hypothetical protein